MLFLTQYPYAAMKKLPTFLILLLLASLAQAQSVRYVSDTLEVPLRRGASLKHKIVRMLPSGSSLEVLQVDKANGYSLIRTQSGSRGWILSRYLMDTPSARESLAQAQQAVEPLQTENSKLKEQLNTLVGQKSNVEASEQKTRQNNQRLSQELAQIRKTAANAIAIDEQNKTLQEQVINLERDLQLSQQTNQSLTDNRDKGWFLLGAGVLLFGMVLGVIIPRMRFQKRNRWGDL